MTSVLYSLLERTLSVGANTGDTVWKDLAAIVQETLEHADVAIIDIRDAAKLQWIDLLLCWVTTVVTLTTHLARAKALTTLAWTATRCICTLLCHINSLDLSIQIS